ncbi:hypothetical protein L326_06195 [Yersinia pestis 113]|nr:hypothetical protein L327_06235 [Yersinia pestis S3]ERP76425.1 hypothetical protein L328_06225 [Yersinia pestis 24H]ERP77253.1 hypothetical protein L326_06195 [Yersinia pestis 113]ERP83565.1 hypothetical protein L325_06175 [Yersinia pestis 9]
MSNKVKTAHQRVNGLLEFKPVKDSLAIKY